MADSHRSTLARISYRLVSVFYQRQYNLQSLLHWLLLGIIMLMVFYPAGVIIMSSFETQGANRISEFSLRTPGESPFPTR